MEETIAAISTPPGRGAVGVIRISGREAEGVLRRLARGFPDQLPRRRVLLRWVYHPASGRRLDEALVWYCPGPATYTGEDMVEIHGHGGLAGLQRLLEGVLAAGARMARPGEFTLRAFMNGKMSLDEAEAVCEVIEARGTRALEMAVACLGGGMRRKVERLSERVVEIMAELDASMDFPEERLGLEDLDGVMPRLGRLEAEIGSMVRSYTRGQLLMRGARVGIVGRPNVGKSSLLNRLLGRQRAVVHPEAGTTRDYVEAETELEGLSVVLIDTVGIRNGASAAERSAAELAEPALMSADLLMVLADASVGVTQEDMRVWELFEGRNRVALWNKTDLVRPVPAGNLGPWGNGRSVSALTGEGVSDLVKWMAMQLLGNELAEPESLWVTQARHKEALEKCAHLLGTASSCLKERALPELCAVELRDVLRELGKILGEDVEPSVLQNIFSRFCIGK